MNKWGGDYLQVARVGYREGELLVVFRNGDEVAIEPRRIAPDDYSDFRWESAAAAHSGIHVVVEGKRGGLELPTDFIRRLTDSAFAAHSAKLAEKQSKLIGRRLKALREKRGISQAELARRAGIQQANLSRIENEQFDIATSTLWKLLAVMGYEPADLSRQAELPAAARSRAR